MTAVQPNTREVYSHRKAKPQKRSARVRIKGSDGKYHTLLTAGIRVERQHAICPQCGYAYGHKDHEGQCCECELEGIAERAYHIEKQGVDLGWGYHEPNREYVREQWHKSWTT